MTRALSTAQTQQNVGGATPPFVAGKNKIANGDFALNTRNLTTFSANVYGFDRWYYDASGGTATVTPQVFAPGNTIPGYEPTNYLRMATTGHSAVSDYTVLAQKLDDVRILAGQTVTISFWAKAASGTPKVGVSFDQFFGTGGSSAVTGSGQSTTISTTWQRYSLTFNLPSISGKTIGTSSILIPLIWTSSGTTQGTRAGSIGIQNSTIDLWGFQLEAGSTATTFTTSGGNPNLEVASIGSLGFDGVLVSTNSSTNGSGFGTNGWAGYQVAGKNAIINGGMDIWQRGTTFTYGGVAYCADRWGMFTNGPAFTFARDSTTVPTGFTYSLKATAPSSGIVAIGTAIETANAIQYAGQNVTVSMYLATSNSSVVNYELDYSTSTDNALGGTWTTISLQSPTTTTTMTRYSATFAVPSTAKSLRLYIGSTTLPTSGTINITGVQLELGSTATNFSRAGGTIQGELAACQRYYSRFAAEGVNGGSFGMTGAWYSTTAAQVQMPLPVTMRTIPSVTLVDGGISVASGARATFTGFSNNGNTSKALNLAITGSSGGVAGQGTTLQDFASGYSHTVATGYLEMSAEL